MQKKRGEYLVSIFFVVSILFLVYGVIFLWQQNQERGEKKVTEENGEVSHSLLNPSVTANLGKHYIVNIAPLREKLVALQREYKEKTYIYFLYLNNGVWIGLNEKDVFKAASTLKVPLAMSVMKTVEDGLIDLDKPYTIEASEVDGRFGELYKKGVGNEYTLGNLMEIMLEQSDNTAANAVNDLLIRLGINDPLANVYTALGWQYLEPPVVNETPNYADINLKTLTNIFLSLYNSTYLTPAHSQQILTYLANTPFNEKIAGGVAKDIPVSHKIGISADTGTFSDCGIVYAPNRNYVLCVGTNGMSEQKANEFMEKLSSSVYTYVVNN
ncbi:MAG: serine hydrolase [Candidatus Paceibacterota bacterium]